MIWWDNGREERKLLPSAYEICANLESRLASQEEYLIAHQHGFQEVVDLSMTPAWWTQIDPSDYPNPNDDWQYDNEKVYWTTGYLLPNGKTNGVPAGVQCVVDSGVNQPASR